MALRGGQKGRISLSHATAVAAQAPLGIESQLADARAKARTEPGQVDLEDLISKSREADATRASFRQLAAPPSAQKHHANLAKKGRLGEIPGYMIAKLRKREAKPPKKYEPTSAEPTSERRAKEPDYGDKLPAFHTALHTGGQVSHQTRVFTEVYDRHIRDDIREAFDLLLRGYEIAQRARSTSSRAYTGAPYTGQSPDHDGHVALTDQDRRDLELFAHAWQELVAQTPEWAERLKSHVLRIVNERTGKLQSVQDLGSFWTGYKKGTDNAQAAGVMAVLDAGLRWQEAVQAGAIKLQYARMRRRAVFEKEAARYAASSKERRDREVAAEKQRRVESYGKQIRARNGR